MARISFRKALRAFQAMRGDPLDPRFVADLEFLENRDLDLSVRQGALLAFNALLITIGTHPVSASPGAPLSLDAAGNPVLVVVSMVALAPIVLSCMLSLRAITYGEEFDINGGESGEALRLRLLAAFVHSIDMQARLLRWSVLATGAGGLATLATWAAILRVKMGG